MTRPYSEDLRERALARFDAGEADRAIAQVLSIAPSCLSKWRKLRRETGALKPGKMNGRKKPILSGPIADWLRERLAAAPFTTRQLVGELRARGIKTDRRVVWVFVVAEGLSFKKNLRCRRNRIALTSPASAGAGKPISIVSPPAGWSFWTRRGSRPTWPRCAAGGQQESGYPPRFLTATGRRSPPSPRSATTGSRPPWSSTGRSTARSSPLMSSRALAPTLQPGDVVILDNLGSHKGKAARQAVRERGAHLLFRPPYSPDLNPIEQLFAKLKHLMRKAEEQNHEATWRRVGQLLDLVPPTECANYLKNSGYASV